MRRFICVFLGLLVSGCISLTPGGTHVKYVTKAEAPNTCKLLGEVDVGPGTAGFGPQPTTIQDAKILMRNKAAEQGGNFLVIDALDSESGDNGNVYSGSGRSYLCDEMANEG